MAAAKTTPGYGCHRLVYTLGRILVRPLMRRKYGFTTSQFTPPGPYLVYSNHVTNADPFLLPLSFPRHMYFVASEHLLRWRVGGLMLKLAAPIIRLKSRTEWGATMEILRRLRAGHNVCLFVEGERTLDGCTMPIADSAAHLAQICGVTLVTYRLEDGYFTEPRWADTVRRQQMSGRVVGVYSPQQLKAMSRAEVNDLIRNDLAVDAYAVQEREQRSYPGQRLAEHLEIALWLCPCCGQIGSLHSQEDRFYCDCGLKLRYTPLGYLENDGGPEPPFTTVRDWWRWQEQQVPALAAAAREGEALLSDEDQILYSGAAGQYQLAEAERGRLALYCDRLEVAGPEGRTRVFPFSRMSELCCHEHTLISFSMDGHLYELRLPKTTSALKYRSMYRALVAGS